MQYESPQEALLWAARASIYAHFAETGQPPAIETIAAKLGVSPAETLLFYRELHARHALLLAEDGMHIRMAHPFSGIATGFRVQAGETSYQANCAWDALGIPAALGRDAAIVIDDPLGGAEHYLAVADGQAIGTGVVHFLLPFRRWYDNLVET